MIMATQPFRHDPVMRDEIVDVFTDVPVGVVVDATIGGGGHTEALLDSRDDIAVLGLDRDTTAIDAARERLARFADRVQLQHRRFDTLPDALERAGLTGISGALFDLGVSSPQLDVAERGFSYHSEGPLDMRMDTTAGRTAAEVVNEYPVDELATILRRYGDERYARRVAAAIAEARPISSTRDLADVVASAFPAPARRRSGGHPARRTFQALRIEVNEELQILPNAIDAAIDATVTAGRVAVLTYHSGEDRIVKERFRVASGACECPPGLPCVCGAVERVRPVRGIPRRPSSTEVSRNRRASSARLRVVECVTNPAPPPMTDPNGEL